MPFLHVNGTSLHCQSLGQGPAILFIHPPFIGSQVFTYLHHDLSQDHRTVMVDLRGHGCSEPGNAKLTMHVIMEDLKQVMDQLGIEEAYLCGYSAGTLPVQAALLMNPGRYKGGILLSGTSGIIDGLYRPLMYAASFTLGLRMKEVVALPVALANADSRLAFANFHREAMQGTVQRWKEYNAECLRYSFTAELRSIKQPILLLCGQNNKEFVRYSQILHERLPHNELYVIRNAHHQILTKEPVKTAGAIRRWIAACEAADPADMIQTRHDFDLEQTGQQAENPEENLL